MLLRLLDRALDTPDQVRAQVLLTLTNLSMERGAWDDSIRFARESAALFDGLGEERLAAWARHFEVFAVWGMADQRDRARALAQTMTETFRRIGDDFGLAYALWPAAQFEDDLDSATAIAAEAEALFRTQGATFGLAHALEGRALIALRAAPFTAAETALAEALTIFAHADNFGCTAHCLEAVAALLAQRGQVEDAAVMLGAAESLRVEVGQQHRGWEREGRWRTERALSQYPQDQITDAQRRGRHLKLPDSVAMAQRLLLGVAERTAVM